MVEQLEKLGTRDLTKFKPIDVILVELMQLPQIDFPLVNKFTEGLYIRERHLPGQALYVTAIHKEQSQFFISQGSVSSSEDGTNWVHYEAPYWGVTEPGTQRIICTWTDTIWNTIHPNPTNEKDVNKLEDRLARVPDLPYELTEGLDLKPLMII